MENKKIESPLTKTIWLCLFVIGVSITVSILFWLWFGKIFFDGWHLKIDFFNTVCGCVTIIGIGIALYQIAELKNRNEVISEATKEEKERKFKREALVSFETCKRGLEYLKKTSFECDI